MLKECEDGYHEYYIIEHKKNKSTLWNEPDGELLCVDNPWNNTNWDWIIPILDEDQKEQRYNLWRIGFNGFSSYVDAHRAKVCCINASENGKLDHVDKKSGLKNARVRYEFRVIKVSISKKSEVIDEMGHLSTKLNIFVAESPLTGIKNQL